MIDLEELDAELDAEASHARTEPEEAEQPADDPDPVNAAPGDRTEEEGQPSQDAAADGREAAAPDSPTEPPEEAVAAAAIVNHVEGRGALTPISEEEYQLIASPTVPRETSAAADIFDGISPTLDDAALAREQIRARYGLALVGLIERGDAPDHVYDRIEALLAA